MRQRSLAFAFVLVAAGFSLHAQSSWLRTDSQHFEIHSLPAVAGEVERVTRSAERAYGRISGRLSFTLATKVPLVMFAPSGPTARADVVAYATSESRWGPAGIRRFVDALIVPRVDKTYDAVFDLTPAEFDAEFRQYAERRFGR